LSRELVKRAKRIVIKIGTRVLTGDDNTLSLPVLSSIVNQVLDSMGNRREFIIVSSGAIALGLGRLGFTKRPSEINLLQASAAMGQSSLMHAYEAEFQKRKHETAQILLTYEDIQNRRRYLNIRNTIFTLLSFGVIPIVNENDTVSFSEIRFGDNDLLSAYLSSMIDADLLLILSDIEGLYDKNPLYFEKARIINRVTSITSHIKSTARGKGSKFSSGGMESKIKAAEIATRSGVSVIITSGKNLDLKSILRGEEIGTFFEPSGKKIKGKKRWIAFNPRVDGIIIIDRGGEKAIVEKHTSLLPAGVVEVKGNFRLGGNVSIRNREGEEIARGLTNFSSKEIELIKGLNSKMIPQILGTETYFEEVVHRDNMVVLK